MSTLLDELRRLVTTFIGRRLDHLALYPAIVVQQRADGTLDLTPENNTVPSCQGVPIRSGVLGVTVEVPAGRRVLLGYAGGDPSRPYAALWEEGDVTYAKVNGGSRHAARKDDATDDGTWTWTATPHAGSPPTTDLTITHRPPGAASVVGVKIAGLPAGVTVESFSTQLAGTDVAQVGKVNDGTSVWRLP